MKIIVDFHCKRPILKVSSISMEFDIFRYALISLMIFGHNLGTKWKLVIFPTTGGHGDNAGLP
jgi:hypothetical protein